MSPEEDSAREAPRAGSLAQRLHDLMRLAELAGHATHPRTRTVTRAGWWALHVVPAGMRWRRQIGETALAAREVGERTRESLGVFFGVLNAQSTSPPTPSVAGEETRKPDLSWRPPVAARARIIVNPTSGSIHGTNALHELRATAQWLTKRGLPTELMLTEAAGHATELARECVSAGMELVIAAGGDGTINDVVQGLAGTAVALGVLPMGTVNVWAREMGIPLSLTQARKLLLRGEHHRVDLGRAGSRYFLLMAGVGVDAEIVRRVEGNRERNWMRRWGLKFLDYVLTAGMLGLTLQPARLTYEVGGKRRTTRALMVALGNTRLHAGAFVFAHKAVADDGLLDMVVIGGGGLAHRAQVFLRALLRRPSQEPHARYARCHAVRLDSTPPLPVQVDGELIGRLPMTFSVAPDALTVIVPPNAPQHLFSRPPVR